MLTRTVLSSARASGKQLALVTASRAQSKYTLPDLPYGYDVRPATPLQLVSTSPTLVRRLSNLTSRLKS